MLLRVVLHSTVIKQYFSARCRVLIQFAASAVPSLATTCSISKAPLRLAMGLGKGCVPSSISLLSRFQANMQVGNTG